MEFRDTFGISEETLKKCVALIRRIGDNEMQIDSWETTLKYIRSYHWSRRRMSIFVLFSTCRRDLEAVGWTRQC